MIQDEAILMAERAPVRLALRGVAFVVGLPGPCSADRSLRFQLQSMRSARVSAVAKYIGRNGEGNRR